MKIIKLLFQIANNLRKHLFKLVGYQIMQSRLIIVLDIYLKKD